MAISQSDYFLKQGESIDAYNQRIATLHGSPLERARQAEPLVQPQAPTPAYQPPSPAGGFQIGEQQLTQLRDMVAKGQRTPESLVTELAGRGFGGITADIFKPQAAATPTAEKQYVNVQGAIFEQTPQGLAGVSDPNILRQISLGQIVPKTQQTLGASMVAPTIVGGSKIISQAPSVKEVIPLAEKTEYEKKVADETKQIADETRLNQLLKIKEENKTLSGAGEYPAMKVASPAEQAVQDDVNAAKKEATDITVKTMELQDEYDAFRRMEIASGAVPESALQARLSEKAQSLQMQMNILNRQRAAAELKLSNRQDVLNQMMTLRRQDFTDAVTKYTTLTAEVKPIRDVWDKERTETQKNAATQIDVMNKILQEGIKDGTIDPNNLSKSTQQVLNNLESQAGRQLGSTEAILQNLGPEWDKTVKDMPDGSIAVIATTKAGDVKVLKMIGGGGGLGGGVDLNNLAFAQQYASTGQIPTGLPKGTFGTIATMAKELPKPVGAIIDRNTGVKSSQVGDALLGGYGSLYSTIELAKKLKDLDKLRWGGVISGTLGKVFGSEAQERYVNLQTQISDLLARARTGAAINATEEKRYFDMLPSRLSEPFFLGADSQVLIENFIDNLSSDLDNKTRAQNLAIYGFSKIQLGDQEYTIGDIVEFSDGRQGRILPDGKVSIQ